MLIVTSQTDDEDRATLIFQIKRVCLTRKSILKFLVRFEHRPVAPLVDNSTANSSC